MDTDTKINQLREVIIGSLDLMVSCDDQEIRAETAQMIKDAVAAYTYFHVLRG